MKVKSSVILSKALELIESGQQSFVCAAIQDVETTIRWDSGQEVQSKATKYWFRFKPARVPENLRHLQEWWPKGDPERIVTLNKAITESKRTND